MHLIGLLAGALGVKKLTDYPQSITKLKQSLPKEEQEAFIADYKKLEPQIAAKHLTDKMHEVIAAAAKEIDNREV